MQQSDAFLRLQLQDSETDSGQLQALTRDLAHVLDRQPEITASLPQGDPEPGKKGDPQAIGTILLQLAGSGGVIISLLGILKTWFERKPTLEVELQRADGAKFKVRAESLRREEFDKLRKQMAEFLGGEPCRSSASRS